MTRPGINRFGAFLILGVAAGAGVRYYINNRARTVADQPNRLINWDQARNMALRVSQWEQAPVPDREARSKQYMQLVKQSEPLIARYLNVELPHPISRVYVVDRREWLEANFTSFEHIFSPIEEIYNERRREQGAFSAMMSDLNSHFLGTQMGVLLGFLGRRVLGQYDLSLLSPEPVVHGALYFVEPNIARIQSHMGLSDHDFRLWIALHETTHVFEFEAYPWVRDHFNGLVRQYFDQLNDQLSLFGGNIGQLMQRIFENWGNKQHWIEMMLTPQQREIFSQLQALMSLVEGYGNHVMNAIGKQLLPSFEHIERRMEQRQKNRTLLEQLFFRLTGMDLKMEQYKQGEQFVDSVVRSHGIEFAARVWERAENLPTLEEIRQPQQWIARMGG